MKRVRVHQSVNAQSNAFTLIELLVVISIIAVLIALLLPALRQAKALAQSAVCLSNQKQIGTAMMTYTGENDDYLPQYAPWAEVFDSVDSPHSYKNFIWLLWPYVAGASSASPNDHTTRVNLGWQTKVKMFVCPSDDRGDGALLVRSYCINATPGISGGSWNAWVATGRNLGMFGLNISRVARPGDKLLLIDVHYDGTDAGYNIYRNNIFYEGGTDTQLILFTSPGTFFWPGRIHLANVAPHSSGSSLGTNMLYADSHAGRATYSRDSFPLLPDSIWVYDE